jgi:hypothetical protein
VRPVSLFRIGLATPASTALQIVLCLWYWRRRQKRIGENALSFEKQKKESDY